MTVQKFHKNLLHQFYLLAHINTMGGEKPLDQSKFSLYTHNDEDNDQQKKYKSVEASLRAKDGIVKERSCTDVFWLLSILVMWFALTVVGSVAVQKGDPYRLISPVNDQGDICGYTGDVTGKPYFYVVLTDSIGVCVDVCPAVDVPLTSTSTSDYYCLNEIYNIYGHSGSALHQYISNTCFTNGEYDLTLNCGCNIIRATTDVFHRCVFDSSEVRNAYVTANTNSYFISFVSDIYSARKVIFGFGIAFSFILCCVWCAMLANKYVGYVLCWTSILIVLLLLSVVCGLAYRTAKEWSHENPPVHTTREIRALRWFSAIVLALSILYACMMVYLRKAINLSIRIIALSAHAIEDIPLLVFTPAIQVGGFILFLIPFFFYLIYTASFGSFTKETFMTDSTPPISYQVSVFQVGHGVPARYVYVYITMH